MTKFDQDGVIYVGLRFHEDWTINKTCRLARKTAMSPAGHNKCSDHVYYSLIWKTAPSPCGHIFQRTGTIFKLNQAIIKKNVIVNLTSRVLTRFYYSRIRKPDPPDPPPGGHVFQHINRTNVLTIVHEDWTKIRLLECNKISARPPCGHVFQLTCTIFELSRDIIETNVLTEIHEDWTINVTSRVLTSFFFNLTYFEHDHDIITSNLWTKFHED
ncbi:hypothetical protein DPMN_012153 [Dreissena polymorpha]|uniref:Uncharacterized protein n=1 Tax=Dreissena polymorpha TaxID=45954 RepID=A0A9D4N500_DREPO|nr:hypothetical protein DPMN_012153 [Dreissena polymorpha]